MNAMNNSNDDVVECPLCMEPLEVDDLNFFPCTCGYQICRFCWHRIRTDENELCPACRKAYPENPADFTPLSQEQISALKAEKRQRDQQRKQKITENRKHLANVRVVQKNLVFVVGLPPRLADADILKKHEYFGKYGKIHKVVINPSTAYAGVQGPSASAYVTYVHNNDALRAIQSVNNIMIDGRLIKTSLGTTKYCSHFMKNQQCPKPDCMYLHELGDPEASFTKEEMHQGKHQEYEKRLHDALIAASQISSSPPPISASTTPINIIVGNGNMNGVGGKTNDLKLMNGSNTINSTINSKEAWPSLSVSPVNKESKLNGKSGNHKENSNSKHENRKHEKTKGEKTKGKNKQQISNNSSNSTSNNINNDVITIINSSNETTDKTHKQSNHINLIDDEINSLPDYENDELSIDNDGKNDTPSLSSTTSSSQNGDSGSASESASGKSSPGTFPDHPHQTTINNSNSSNNTSIISNNSISGVSNGGLPHLHLHHQQQHNNLLKNNNNLNTDINKLTATNNLLNNSGDLTTNILNHDKNLINGTSNSNTNSILNHGTINGININNLMDTSARFSKLSLFDDNNSFFSTNSFQPYFNKLDGGNNINSLNNGNSQSNINSPQLPDLLNGTESDDTDRDQKDAKLFLKGLGSIHNHHNNLTQQQQLPQNGLSENLEKYSLPLNTAEDWEAAFKYVMTRNNKQTDEQQDELLRSQDMQKRNLANSIGVQQLHGGLNGDFSTDYFHFPNDISRLSQTSYMQQQQHQQQQQQQQRQQQQHNNIHNENLGHNIYAGNMVKFFDFHKNQQQQQQTQQHPHYLLNGHSNGPAIPDHLNLLENNRINSHYMEQTNGLLGPQLQKQRLFNKYEQIGSNNHNNHNIVLANNQQNRLHNQFQPNTSVDDDLGFDPFIETQKALAELMENEMVQQQSQTNHSKLLDNCQRTRMPPPGFNHMNAFGFGVPRAQGSKILPFMNIGNNPTVPPQPQTNWAAQHLGYCPPIQPNEHQQHVQQQQQQQQQNNQHNKTGFGSMSDWTTLDPAIVSFRQYPSFLSGQQQQQQQQQQQNQHNSGNDIFMPHSQQNVQQPGQGFGHHGHNLQSSIINQQQQQQQQNSPAQMNYSTNWLNSDQNMYMNNLTNGFSNNFDKFTIPMPPGFQNNVAGNKQQKAECIN